MDYTVIIEKIEKHNQHFPESWAALQNEDVVPKIGADTAENEPFKV